MRSEVLLQLQSLGTCRKSDHTALAPSSLREWSICQSDLAGVWNRFLFGPMVYLHLCVYSYWSLVCNQMLSSWDLHLMDLFKESMRVLPLISLKKYLFVFIKVKRSWWGDSVSFCSVRCLNSKQVHLSLFLLSITILRLALILPVFFSVSLW